MKGSKIAWNGLKEQLADMRSEKGKTPRKRLFIGLVTGTALLLCLALLLGWIVPAVGFVNIHPLVPYVTACIFVVCIIRIVCASSGLVLQIVTGNPCWGAFRVRGITIKVFLPLIDLLGRLIGR